MLLLGVSSGFPSDLGVGGCFAVYSLTSPGGFFWAALWTLAWVTVM